MQEPGGFDRPATANSTFESPTMPTDTSIILVVEDDAIVRTLIVDVLEELGFRVLEADGSEKALEFINNEGQGIDLLMTDVGLPVMDGRELAKQARMPRPGLPVLFASGYAENIEVPDGMHLIGKPFSIDQLRDKVKAILV
jgi:CheY-like chemotaxis protein